MSCGTDKRTHTLPPTLCDTDDFFVGIGDINSTFLPKLDPLASNVPTGPPPPIAAPGTISPVPVSPQPSPAGPPSSVSSATLSTPPSTASIADETEGLGKDEMVTRNTLALEAQMEERPLAKKQEELQEASAAQTNGQEVSSHVGMADSGVGGDAAEVGKEKPARRALLKNDDVELERVKAVRVFDVLAISDDGSGHIQNVYLFIALSFFLFGFRYSDLG